MASRVLEGTWEEIARQGARLAGKHVRVIVFDEPAPEAGSVVTAVKNGAGIQGGSQTAGRRPSIRGKYAGLLPSTEEYLLEKRRETAREDQTGH